MVISMADLFELRGIQHFSTLALIYLRKVALIYSSTGLFKKYKYIYKPLLHR